jgi:multidrug efflux pump subunit AcrB
MTLGGLALAVGILVDDATVTIENINYHLEQGKPVEQSILDGANQIVTPAFVSLLCICIVFVPMFFLTGVARFLFVPMAEAVMFAMIWSFILSRTLVPTMAKYLLQPHVHHEGDRRRRAIRWCASSVPSRHGSNGSELAITICCRWRWGGGRYLLPASLRWSRCRSCWCRFSAATSFRRSTPATS